MQDLDAKLVERFQRGDWKAFAMLVDRYEKPIFNAALRITHNRDDAADITQTVFVKTMENIRSFDRDRSLFSWLYRIAVNESLNMVSRRKRRGAVTLEPVPAPATPEDDYALVESVHYLQRALNAMSFDHRVVIVLKHLLLLSYQEISDVLEIPQKTVKSRLFSARQTLRRQLLAEGYVR